MALPQKVFPIDVEVVLPADSTDKEDKCISRVKSLFHLTLAQQPVVPGMLDISMYPWLSQMVQAIRICEPHHCAPPPATFNDTVFNFIVYQLSGEEAHLEYVTSGQQGSSEADAPSSYTRWPLPSPMLEDTWESLVYGSNIKGTLLSYAAAALSFADAGVPAHVCSANRVILLAGPPGTGKTSIARALAHKLAARCSRRFPHADLIELNAHSLFSRWFSESGKLVTQLFQHLETLAEAPDRLLVLLIDEVESLAMARKSGGSEPSDSLRAVNALLTALDKLRHHPNVLVINSTNLTEAIDPAFIDRADLKLVVGLPDAAARFAILLDCVNELIGRGLVQSAGDQSSAALQGMGPTAVMSPSVRASPSALASAARGSASINGQARHQLATVSPSMTAASSMSGPASAYAHMSSTPLAMRSTSKLACSPSLPPATAAQQAMNMLLDAATWAEGFSGRALRKLPLQAYALLAMEGAIPVSACLHGCAKAPAALPGSAASASPAPSLLRHGHGGSVTTMSVGTGSSAGYHSASQLHSTSSASSASSYGSGTPSSLPAGPATLAASDGSVAPARHAGIPLDLFISALQKAVEEEHAVRDRFAAGVS